MPTATGKLRKGEKIRHIESGIVCVVLERNGNGADYSVILKREDGGLFPPSNGTSPTRKLLLLQEVGYWIGHGWEVVK